MFGKKFIFLTFVLALVVIGGLVFSIDYFKKEEVRVNTPEWLKVQIFEYEKQNKLNIQKVSKCQTKGENQSRNVYILSFKNSQTKIVLNENTTFECDTKSSKCEIANSNFGLCLTLVNK